MSSHDITVLGFAIILAALLGTEVTARTGRAGVPTFTQVVTRVMRTRTGRVGVLVGWAWLGLHFFAKLSENDREGCVRARTTGDKGVLRCASWWRACSTTRSTA